MPFDKDQEMRGEFRDGDIDEYERPFNLLSLLCSMLGSAALWYLILRLLGAL